MALEIGILGGERRCFYSREVEVVESLFLLLSLLFKRACGFFFYICIYIYVFMYLFIYVYVFVVVCVRLRMLVRLCDISYHWILCFLCYVFFLIIIISIPFSSSLVGEFRDDEEIRRGGSGNGAS